MSEAAKQHDLSVLEQMPSLGQSTADLKKQAEAAVEAKTPEQTKEEKADRDPRTKPEYPFDFEWKDGNGKVWKGKFKNTRLTIRQQQLVGVLQAQMSGNTPYNALDGLTQEINLMIAHLAFSLDEEARPDWGKDLRDLDSIELLQALYKEVALHEAIFHGLRPIEEGSKKGG